MPHFFIMKKKLTSAGFYKLNKRRIFLIEKKFKKSRLTVVEQKELAELQKDADHYVDSLSDTSMDRRALRSLRREYKRIMAVTKR